MHRISLFLSGSVYGYSQVDDYDSLLSVLKNMSDAQKEELVNKVKVRAITDKQFLFHLFHEQKFYLVTVSTS